MPPLVKVVVILRPFEKLNQNSSLQDRGLSTKWWYFAAMLLAASSDHPRLYGHGWKRRYWNDKYEFKVSWWKWNLRPSSSLCSAFCLQNLLSTNSSFRPKWNWRNNDLDSRVGGIDHASISESNCNPETSFKVKSKFKFTGPWFIHEMVIFRCYVVSSFLRPSATLWPRLEAQILEW